MLLAAKVPVYLVPSSELVPLAASYVWGDAQGICVCLSSDSMKAACPSMTV